MLAHVFGLEADWPGQDLVGFTDTIDTELTLAAYASGLFPMPLHESDFHGMGWWSPVRRAILPLGALRVSHSLRQALNHYRTSVDTAFEQVLAGCADPKRPDGWIDQDVVAVYTQLFERGVAHSVETWDDEGRLVGGLYGVGMRGLFAGESMFHDPEHGRDASKVALVRLVDTLRARPDGVALSADVWVFPRPPPYVPAARTRLIPSTLTVWQRKQSCRARTSRPLSRSQKPNGGPKPYRPTHPRAGCRPSLSSCCWVSASWQRLRCAPTPTRCPSPIASSMSRARRSSPPSRSATVRRSTRAAACRNTAR
ncbi:leucyl/phenylalanyl-tRNA--protein transferase [Propionibacterium freudenreichii]|uniref:leucyl/phenylalanyl-tRNA--protein transferase n=1 Tax=Propionibacterium freudenreichii TaxID=1744 RepID=UPI0005432688|nr:leucyl/phenylalanyl-tRNA--protein transferase [Propionibacterium freudenreichii]CEG98524.1 Leucyl/phenylalanyl-tRNA-protein transferase [Propionibacterium freudenreichii]CEH10171.1 Leucyl/phenylalanyl-tRNA-protein transferase [Propionibacterium freudenreichii]CEI30940.1 Leucyl/phenylalanyl-tRNA-protein transferase [Propionibacterium freudenreichii]CEI47246.1 Leucyl/phenylalanyl-tRNA-protein transferase [Propionibacterium freudenreichii]